MKLSAFHNYGPIKPFGTTDIPDFTIIIGPNGAGKSQLLRGISDGNIYVGDPPPGIDPQSGPHLAQGQIRNAVLITNSEGLPSFDSGQSLAPQSQGAVIGPSVPEFKLSVTRAVLDRISLELDTNLLELVSPSLDPWVLGPEGLADKLGIVIGSTQYQQITDAFDRADDALRVTMSGRGGLNQVAAHINQVAERMQIRPTLVTSKMVAEFNTIGSFSVFHPHINKVISHYRDNLSNNKLRPMNGGEELSKDEFEGVYGAAPWHLIDEILEDFGLPYTVSPPSFAVQAPVYNFSFRHIKNGHTIQPDSVSSGEKTLLRFALAILPYDPLRVSLQKPSLLLLDELDASLHPQILNRWMETLREEFVKKRGIKCILTTHSPITVALAPEDSIFEMSESNPAPTRIDKQQALNRLTVGLPTLSVDYAGQRQVFVESDTDAAIFNSINAKLKKSLGLQRSLSFISTGFRNKVGLEINAGFSVVEKVTNALRESGNRQVFGLIDWDLKRSSTDSIKVIAENSHYTLENILLDPLLVGALLLRDAPMQFPNEIEYTMLGNNDQGLNQEIADFVQSNIAYPPGATAELQVVKYLGAPDIKVRQYLTNTPGHDIEALLAASFPYLRQFVTQRGKLVKEVVDRVLPNYHDLCPLPIVTAFKAVSDQDS